jgi:FAD:protein FMN transferase
MPAHEGNPRIEVQHVAMGTVYSIAAYAHSSVSLEMAAKRAFAEIDRLDALMSHYRPPSEICAINRQAAEGPMPVSAELFALLAEAFRISTKTGGAFDVTVGPLMKAWGFFRRVGRVPSDDELAETQARTGYQRVRLDAEAQTIGFERPGMELDLGAIGKGYAVDRAATVLRECGVENALISSGTSSIAALGAPPGERGWQIALCDPRDRWKTARLLRLHNLSISVSGGYEQMFVMNGRAYTHLLDPRSGRPVVDGMRMVAVIGHGNAWTDALSTAFFVMSEEEARTFVARESEVTCLVLKPNCNARKAEQILLQSPGFTMPAEGLLEWEEAEDGRTRFSS